MTTHESDLTRRKTRSSPVRGASYAGVPSLELEEECREKPWQRVPSVFIVPVLALFLLLAYLLQCHEDAMPDIVRSEDVPEHSWQTFSEESAQVYLQRLLGSGPRVAGTRYHLEQTREMKLLVDDIASRSKLPVRTDWQMASGDYWLEFKVPYVNSYSNVSNIAALLEGRGGRGGEAAPALLLNCHYDSVPYALGAGDNGAFCAAMLEVLDRLSRRNSSFENNVIFLFNGAEENPLQGSHAFLSHPWARSVAAVINLDAAGMNGHPNVFQVSDPHVLAAYGRAARRPSAQALGQLLFTSGLVPSDTDYRVWRDFGHLRGIDMAFTKWGAVYHTRHDTTQWLRPGVLQSAGDMLLRLVVDLADDPHLSDERDPEAVIYFDYMNLFLVVWGAAAARAAEGCAVGAGLLSVAYYCWLVGCRLSTLRELVAAAAARLAAALAGVAALTIVTAFMLATTTQLRYLSEPWLVVPLYWLPCLLAAAATAHRIDAWRAKKSGLSRSIRSLQATAATRLLLTGALLLLCAVPATAAARYLLAAPLLLMAGAAAVTLTAVRGVRLTAWQQLTLELSLSLPAVCWLLSLSLRLLALLLPTLGRLPLPAPDTVAAAGCGALALLAAMPLSGVEILFSGRRQWAVLTSLAALCAVCMLLPLSPYRPHGPATQRHHWFHTEVVRHDASGAVTSRSSGVVVTPHDAYTIQSVRAELRGVAGDTRGVGGAECERDALCGLPVYRLRALPALSNSMWIAAGAPAGLRPPPALRVTSRRCDAHTCTLAFTMTGPAHNTLTVWPHHNVSLARWSWSAPVRPTLAHGARPLYVVIHSAATYTPVFEPLQFNITFDVSQWTAGTPLADMSHHSHLIAHPEHYTGEYRALLNAAPPYFNIASYMSYRHDYVV